jgi:nucleotide-binding universal stress UspA family protein
MKSGRDKSALLSARICIVPRRRQSARLASYDSKLTDFFIAMKHTELLNRNELRPVERPGASPGELTWNRSANARRETETKTRAACLLPTSGVILVGMDFTELAIKALDSALALAGRFGASILLIHVVNPFFTSALANRITRDKARTESRRRALADLRDLARAKENPNVNIQCLVRHGVPEYEILCAAERLGASLIVLGHQPRHSLSRMILGSVSRSVLSAAPCPVLVVNQHSAAAWPMTSRAAVAA